MSYQEEALKRTQDTVERLCLSDDFGTGLLCLDCCPYNPNPDKYQKIVGKKCNLRIGSNREAGLIIKSILDIM